MKAIIEIDDVMDPILTVIHDDGSKRKTHTTLRNILKMFDDAYEEVIERKEIKRTPRQIVLESSDVLPRNTIKYSKMEKRFDGDALVQCVAIAVESFHANVPYYDSLYKDVAFPNMVFIFKVVDQRIVRKYVAAYKGKTIRKDTPLYLFPYSNVTVSGSMCYYGGEIVDLVELETWPYRWASTEMNNDYYHEKRTLYEAPLRELLELFSDGASFDDDILKPMNFSFEEWYAHIINN